MSFLSPKTPKLPDPVEKAEPDEKGIDQTLRDRERRRQGFAASLLTGGSAGTGPATATKKLLGG